MSAGTRGGREEKEPQGDPQKQLRPAAPRVWCTLCACGCPPLPDARRWEKGSTRIRIRFESPDTPRPTPAPEYLAPHATPGTRARPPRQAQPAHPASPQSATGYTPRLRAPYHIVEVNRYTVFSLR